MKTAYDFLTVGGFLAVIVYYVGFTDRDFRHLRGFMISVVALAVANQIGNAGWDLPAAALIAGAAVYAVKTAREA